MSGKFRNVEELKSTENTPIEYIASLRKNEKHFCNACLISYIYLLTAAQCVIACDRYENEQNTTLSVLLNGTLFTPVEFYIPEEYNFENAKTMKYDMGSIKVCLSIILKKIK